MIPARTIKAQKEDSGFILLSGNASSYCTCTEMVGQQQPWVRVQSNPSIATSVFKKLFEDRIQGVLHNKGQIVIDIQK